MIEKPFFVILTNRCNLTCPHCYNELDPLKMVKVKDLDPLSRERLDFLFRELVAQGYEKVFFSGGEALLREDAPDVIAAASSLGLKTALFTNGHLFTPPLIERLAAAGLGEVRISLNELAWIKDRRNYERVLGRQTEWIGPLRAAGIGVGVIYIISKANVHYVDETRVYVRALGAGMKLQPLYLPHDSKAFSSVAADAMEAGEWEELIVELEAATASTNYQEEATFEVYGNPWKMLRYLRFVRDVYALGARPDFCPTGPMLVVDSDGFFHPCLFRFDLVCGHISDDDAVRRLRSTVDSHADLATAPCFRTECLSAYR